MLVSQINSTAYNSSTPAVQQSGANSSRSAAPNSDLKQATALPVELKAIAVERAKESVSASSLKEATQKINQTMSMMSNNLQFTVDDETGLDVVKVVDVETKEVIRQFPSEEVLAIAKALDQLQGLLVRDKA